jgi:hypothetical protein
MTIPTQKPNSDKLTWFDYIGENATAEIFGFAGNTNGLLANKQMYRILSAKQSPLWKA